MRWIYQFGHHLAVQINVAVSLPVKIHIELDAIVLRFGDLHLGEPNRHIPKVKLGEVQ